MKDFLLKIKIQITNLTAFKKINPHNHWNNLLYIFFTITVVLILFSFYLLYDIRSQKALQLTSDFVDKPSFVNEKLLSRVLEQFNNKSFKQKDIKDGMIGYTDPSI